MQALTSDRLEALAFEIVLAVILGAGLFILTGCQAVERIAVMNAKYDEAVAECYGDETGGQCYLDGYAVPRGKTTCSK